MHYDFSGYATRPNLKCSDGVTISSGAFDEMDGKTVPLVWQHLHDDPANVLGHALLEARNGGVYAYCTFNDTDGGKTAKKFVQHKDITSLSIYANKLTRKGSDVTHGIIREVSLVLAGANPGAMIDNVVIQHSDGSAEEMDDQAIIYANEMINSDAGEIKHADKDNEMDSEEDKAKDSNTDDETIADIYDSLTDKQKNVVEYIVSKILEENGITQSDSSNDSLKGTDMHHNIFEGDKDKDNDKDKKNDVLTHSQIDEVFANAKTSGSLKEAIQHAATTYGIENIDLLFPDFKTVTNSPEFIKRRSEWVNEVLNGVHATPFTRIKSLQADITANEARAKGYIKGNRKKEEFFKLVKRTTNPTTVYKKQKLDRDDILDITDFDVVAWLKAEMRLMLDEEIARSVLIGDGRTPDDPDKIKEDCVRPILKEDDLYAIKKEVPAPKQAGDMPFLEAVLRVQDEYEGSGAPTLFISNSAAVDLLLSKDAMGRRYYENYYALAAALGVRNIVIVPQFKDVTEGGKHLQAIMVNLNDYSLGTDRGGQISMFDDFDIDYNQQKYLLETRYSGALTKIHSAVVFFGAASTPGPVNPKPAAGNES